MELLSPHPPFITAFIGTIGSPHPPFITIFRFECFWFFLREFLRFFCLKKEPKREKNFFLVFI